MLLKLEKGRESIVNKQQLDVGCGGLRFVTMFSLCILYSHSQRAEVSGRKGVSRVHVWNEKRKDTAQRKRSFSKIKDDEDE